MNPKIAAQLRAFRGDSNWHESHQWLRPARDRVGQSTASVFARALSWLRNWPGGVGWVYQVVRALPHEGALADDVVRARQLLLGVENNLDDHSATATCRGASGPTRTLVAWKQPYSLIQRGWYALKRIREQNRLRDTLCRLSDRELADMGMHRSEIEYVVGTHRSEAEYTILRPF
jgi:uncharacterized protein YjiS (DUF1127 family)